jgi:hypothetical protein
MSYTITPTAHPVAMELANSHPSFVEKARLYQWRTKSPRSPVPLTGWPPGISGSFGVFDYWYDLIQKNRHYSLDTWVEPTTLEEAVERALELATLDPTVAPSYPIPQVLQVNIAGRDYHVRASKVVTWAKFAGSTYDVVLDDARVGRVTDAAFELKVS